MSKKRKELKKLRRLAEKLSAGKRNVLYEHEMHQRIIRVGMTGDLVPYKVYTVTHHKESTRGIYRRLKKELDDD